MIFNQQQKNKMKTNWFVHDCETAPLMGDALKKIMPAFDESEVGVGNIKDPEKIKAKIEAERLKHEEKFYRKAALSATTGRVLCIGGLKADGDEIILEGDEKDMLTEFWTIWTLTRDVSFIGFNCRSFDIPFLARRSWVNGVKVPTDLVDGRYQSGRIIDLMEVWDVGKYGSEAGSQSLDMIAKILGVGEKSGSGKDFANLYISDRKAALEYLHNDLMLTMKVGVAMGVIEL